MGQRSNFWLAVIILIELIVAAVLVNHLIAWQAPLSLHDNEVSEPAETPIVLQNIRAAGMATATLDSASLRAGHPTKLMYPPSTPEPSSTATESSKARTVTRALRSTHATLTTAKPTVTPTPRTTPGTLVSAKSTVAVTQVSFSTPVLPSAPQPSITPSSANSLATTWLPERSQWPPSTSFQAAAVLPRMQYWHLVRALYCDYNDQGNNCPDLPGGGAGTATYVMLIDASGGRVNAPLQSPSGQEEKSQSDMCNCNYTFESSGATIQIGRFPSDSISGLDLYSVKTGLSRYHVRYFLTFQLTVR